MQVCHITCLFGKFLSAAGVSARLLSTSNNIEAIFSLSNDIHYLKFLRSHRITLRSSRATAKKWLDSETNYARNLKDTGIISKLKMWPVQQQQITNSLLTKTSIPHSTVLIM